jgi:hypothetical protein
MRRILLQPLIVSQAGLPRRRLYRVGRRLLLSISWIRTHPLES